MPHVYKPVGKCIYCGASPEDAGTDGLSKEHIIPDALGGDLILPKSSCHSCRGETHAFEGMVAHHWEGARAHVHWKSRHRPRPETLLTNAETKARVARERHPAVIQFPVFETLPNLLQSKRLLPGTGSSRAAVKVLFADGAATKLNQLSEGLEVVVRVDTFMRTIAKIAHSFAVAELGLDNIEFFCREIILNKGDATQLNFQNFIGDDNSKVKRDVLHHLAWRWEGALLVIEVQLYALAASPTYHVVVGRKIS